MSTTKGLCWGCNLPIAKGHYHDTPAPGHDFATCRQLNKMKEDQQRNAVKRTQAAALNGGKSLGKWNKDLATRLAPLVIRSHGEVAKIMGLTAEGVRIIELRALAKIRAALLPFKNARSGSDKVRQVTTPIPSL